jgi:hypothetical protein
MATNHESSFGAKLKNANDCISSVRGYANYTPPRNEETADALAAITATAEQLNKEVALKKSTYKTEVAKRLILFKDGPASLEKLLSPIRKAVGAHFGKNSDESRQVSSIVRKMRTTRLEKPPAAEGSNGQTEDKISSSQKSFGSMSQHFKDLANTVSTYKGYNPSNSNITNEKLLDLSEKINIANNAVSAAYQQMNNAQKERLAVYIDLSDRISRVKLYVASQYGNKSNEYKLISKLKV